MKYACTPLSRREIRAYAHQIRKALHLESCLYFPVEEFLEILHLLIGDPDFYFEIVPDSDWEQIPSVHAYYDVEQRCIYIRESVYNGAGEGCGRDRMTIIHECAHALLLQNSGITLSRNFDDTIPAYRDPEWQAKCLAAELMIPSDLIDGMSAQEIARQCGVSMGAASYQLKKRIA